MFRRRFLQRIGFAGASGLAVMQDAAAGAHKTVTYRVKGFSCVTCAVGLETMLRQKKGIARAVARYPQADVLIEFDPALITDQALKAFIKDMGFSVEEAHASQHPRLR